MRNFNNLNTVGAFYQLICMGLGCPSNVAFFGISEQSVNLNLIGDVHFALMPSEKT